MANGEFLRGISRGIFGEMGRAEQEQKTRDREKTLQTIDFLSNMASQVEPDSLPMLMDILGKTIGVKGKTKNFWSAFGGTPDRSIEDQLGTLMNQATSSMVGPQEAKQARQTYKGELLEPFRAQGTRPRSVEALPYRTPPTLADRLILRDPRQEKLEEIETRYGSQLENQRVMQQERYVDALGRQQNQSRLKLEEMNAKSQLDSMRSLNALSNQLLAGDKTLTPQQAVEKAGDILGSTAEAKLEALKMLVPLRSALTTKAQAEVKTLGPGGTKPAEDRARLKNYLTAQESLTRSQGTIKGIDEAQSKLINTINSKINYLPGFKFRFDPQKGSIEVDEVPSGFALGDVNFAKSKAASKAQKEIGDYIENMKLRKVEEEKTGGLQKSVEEYGKMREGSPRKKSVQPPQKLLRPGERVGLGTSRSLRSGEKIMRADPDKYQILEIVEDQSTGVKWRVVQKGKDHVILAPIR